MLLQLSLHSGVWRAWGVYFLDFTPLVNIHNQFIVLSYFFYDSITYSKNDLNEFIEYKDGKNIVLIVWSL